MKYKVDFINSSYRRFFIKHEKEIMAAFRSCASRGELTLRQEVWDFEKRLARYIGTRYAVGVASGTDALFLSLKALGIGPGDEIITVSHTFIASLQAIVHCGATPILMDVKEDELIDTDQIEKHITPHTKAILPVHLTGKVCDMDVIMKLAKRHRLFVVEDACQALGANYGNKMAGSFGDTGCFSFNTAKMLGAYGDAGAITTNNHKLYQSLCLLRNHWNMSQLSVKGEDFPQPKKLEWGWKSRLDNIWAAILLVKAKYFPAMLKRRAEIAGMYQEAFIGIPRITPFEQPGMVWQEYHLRIPQRKKFVVYMTKKGIETLVRDKIPNHKQKGLGLSHWKLPITEDFAKTLVRLPLYPELTNSEVTYVIGAVRSFFEK